jgi:SsrA-binding protein
MNIIAQNKKAYHDYEIHKTIEAGIVLTGDEVKSIRAHHVSMVGSFANIHDGELYLLNMHIAPYEKAFGTSSDDLSRRTRKLLVHKKELHKLIGEISQKGRTIIPLRLYSNKKNKIKVELGIATHKKAAGKKQVLKERDITRETQRELRNKFRF